MLIEIYGKNGKQEPAERLPGTVGVRQTKKAGGGVMLVFRDIDMKMVRIYVNLSMPEALKLSNVLRDIYADMTSEKAMTESFVQREDDEHT